MRKGLFLAFSAFLFVLVSYFAHLWLSLLEGFPGNFSPTFSQKLPSTHGGEWRTGDNGFSRPLARQVFFIFAEGEVQLPEEMRNEGAYFRATWPEVPGHYTRYAMLITGAPLELVGVHFTPGPIGVENLIGAMGDSGVRVAFSGPRWWKELLGASAADLYASFFAYPAHYSRIIPEGVRLSSLFQVNFVFMHIPEERVLLEELIGALRFNVSQDILALLTPSSFALWGKGIIPGRYGEISILDIAPTFAAITGSSVPAATRGRPILQVFSIADELKAAKLVSVVRQRTTLADSYLREIIGVGLDEGLRSDSALALNSLELGNVYGALELAKLTLMETEEAMDEARARAIASGRWRRMPLLLLWVLMPPLLLASRRRPYIPVLIIAGLLSFTMNAWLFRREWPYLSWEAVAYMDPSFATLKRTLLSLYVPTLLPLLWLFLEGERDLIEIGEALAGYGLWVLYFTSLPVAFSFLAIGAVPAYFFPPLSLYATELLGLWQLFLNGLLVLPLPFAGMGVFVPLKFTERFKP